MMRNRLKLVTIFASLLLPVVCVAKDAMIKAVTEGDGVGVKELIRLHGKQVNTMTAPGGVSPLHLAAKHKRFDIALLLVNNGADVDAHTDSMSTPLHWAAFSNDEDIAQLLLKKGSNPNAKTKQGSTPLHWGANGDSEAVARLLLANGAKLEPVNHAGLTPLHLAAHHNSLNVAALLLERGADPYAQSTDRHTPRYYAKDIKMQRLFNKFVSESAKPPTTKPDPSDTGTEGEQAVADQSPPSSDTGAPDDAKPIPPETKPNGDEPAVTADTGDKRPDSDRRVFPVPTRDTATTDDVSPVIRFKRLPGAANYRGTMQAGTPHGSGTLVLRNDETYTGDWLHGRKHGQGTYTFPTGERYEGSWRANLPHGKGTYTFSNGGQIKGYWEKGRLIRGQGRYVFANGDTYEGEWEYDRMQGYGVYHDIRANQTYKGYWMANELIREADRPDTTQ